MSLKRLSNKGIAYLIPIAIGMITLAAGVTLMFIIPEYLLGLISNGTGLTSYGTCHTYNTSPSECGEEATNCCLYELQYTAQTKVDTVRNIGMAVIIIALVWIIIAVISGAKKGGM